ncbi:hypothetical protein B0J14DRAFT_129666 [Halenospora varia]|nr:hypothetical protein B0J14DRAFT_129666 [Halenospora varia]
MATSAALVNFGDKLSTELWNMIFEELDADKGLPRSVREVSKRFCDIATPIVYRKIVLSSKMLTSRPDPVASRVIADIRIHTKWVTIADSWNINWYRVASVLPGWTALRDLRLDCLFRPKRSMGSLLFCEELRHLRMHICETHHSIDENTYTSTFWEQANIVSLWTPSSCYFSKKRSSFYAHLLASSPNLKEVQLMFAPRLSDTSGTIAPLTRLKISCQWPYNRDEVAKFWDFSSLRTLHLNPTSLGAFLESVSAEAFPNLRQLVVCKQNAVVVGSSQDTQVSRFLTGKSKLEDLAIIAVSSGLLARHFQERNPTLRRLVLKGMGVYAGAPVTPGGEFNLEDITTVHSLYPNLVELDVVLWWNETLPDKNQVTQTFERIAKFRNLRTLRVTCSARFLEALGTRNSPKLVKTLFTHMQSRKAGIPFSSIVLSVTTGFGRVPLYHYICTWNSEGKATFRPTKDAPRGYYELCWW